MSRHYNDLKDKKFGRLVVLHRLRTNIRGVGVWLCRCDCGVEKEFTVDNLTNKQHWTKSCGCLRKERMQQMGRKSGINCPSYKHGMRYSPEYYVWNAMRQRCSNPKDSNFSNYGGRGISICKQWNSFENFYADMGARPSSKYSLDRINVYGNYEPANCRWATFSEQMSNRRSYKAIENFTTEQLLMELSRRDNLRKPR